MEYKIIILHLAKFQPIHRFPPGWKSDLGPLVNTQTESKLYHQWCLIYQVSISDHKWLQLYLHQSSRLQKRNNVLRLGEVWLKLLAKHLQLLPDIVVTCNLILPWNMQLLQCILTSLCLCHKQDKIKLVSDKTWNTRNGCIRPENQMDFSHTTHKPHIIMILEHITVK